MRRKTRPAEGANIIARRSTEYTSPILAARDVASQQVTKREERSEAAARIKLAKLRAARRSQKAAAIVSSREVADVELEKRGRGLTHAAAMALATYARTRCFSGALTSFFHRGVRLIKFEYR